MEESLIQENSMFVNHDWFYNDAQKLIDQRNLHEVDGYKDLILSYQQLLLRVSSFNSLNASTSITNSKENSNFQGTGDSQQVVKVVEKYLSTIQNLEQELATKNADMALMAADHVHIVQENKSLVAAQGHWETQLDFFTKRLEEEMLLNEEKDKALKELEPALLLVRNELQNQKELTAKAEYENSQLIERVRALEGKVLAKTNLLSEWLNAHAAGDVILPTSDDFPNDLPQWKRPSALTSSQMMAEDLSRLVLDETNSQLPMADSDNIISFKLSKVSHAIRAHATEVNSVCFNASGKIVFSGSSDGTVRAWESSSGRAMGEYRPVGTPHPLLCVRVSDDSQYVLGTGCDRKTFVWKVGTCRIVQTLSGHKGKVLAAEFHSSEQNPLIVTGASDRTMRLWDLLKGRSLQTVACRSSCNDIAMHISLGGQYVSAHQDGILRFWDTRTNQTVHELPGLHGNYQITSVSCAQNSSSGAILTCSRDHTLHLVDIRMYESVQKFSHPSYQCGFDWSKANLSPDGKFATAGGNNGAIYHWNTLTGKLEKEFPPPSSTVVSASGSARGHQGAIACCVWDSEGQRMSSSDKNGLVVLWE